MSTLFIATFLIVSFLLICVESQTSSCGSNCNNDGDCLRNSPASPCSFCANGVCSSLCGVGCRQHSDCQNGGLNRCILCSGKRNCVDPRPQCGDYCENDSACLVNGTYPSGCSRCDVKRNQCHNGTLPSLCGKVCSGSGQCASDPHCSQCVGFYCSKPAGCGQVCISSGQRSECQMTYIRFLQLTSLSTT
jgi:hypothetical protein